MYSQETHTHSRKTAEVSTNNAETLGYLFLFFFFHFSFNEEGSDSNADSCLLALRIQDGILFCD